MNIYISLILLKPQLLLHFLKCNPRPIYSCKWLFVAGIHMLLSFTRPTDPQPNALYDASFSNTFYFFCTLAYTFCFSLSSAQRELQWSLERQVHAQNEWCAATWLCEPTALASCGRITARHPRKERRRVGYKGGETLLRGKKKRKVILGQAQCC